mmetsp:Transcript_5487/g.9299  ORF Transcript_5487/g.9299 Transcript_5487/m.9299 type:complete len:112 (-) Transcript_5487:137-472(-)|eukprot:CAMPEP_0168618112 /NCGR_PEP_ID=MMETSP0449_2-20121227/5899_1 /TAXON_ID=1082188 /ORGANISM="Strombidium rassoulzadegani, Strain ras09" /LENGTH=111 /DNA_ID=CAMNT_0008658967 /DNA_START=24 /DNA_END=359 /DNA_ORIENTATION=+
MRQPLNDFKHDPTAVYSGEFIPEATEEYMKQQNFDIYRRNEMALRSHKYCAQKIINLSDKAMSKEEGKAMQNCIETYWRANNVLSSQRNEYNSILDDLVYNGKTKFDALKI